MESAINNISTGQSAMSQATSMPDSFSAAQPITQAPMAAPAVNYSAPQPPKMENGGQTSSFANFFDDVNWLDVAVLSVGIAAIFYSIRYYRIKIKSQKKEFVECSNRIDMLDAKVAAIQKNVQDLQKPRTEKKVAL
jgi:hypothetical protein